MLFSTEFLKYSTRYLSKLFDPLLLALVTTKYKREVTKELYRRHHTKTSNSLLSKNPAKKYPSFLYVRLSYL